MKKALRKMIFIPLLIVVALYGALYLFQEKLIFRPDVLGADYEFNFAADYEEFNIPTQDGTRLNGLLFKAENSKGLVFYLHGNGGALDDWAEVAPTYTDLGYDVFLLDYRGYGKSGGSIYSEAQMYGDVQTAYDVMRERYPEDKIVMLGYSIGTGSAAMLAATNQPRLLILQAPYFNLVDLIRSKYPVIPPFLIKYHFRTNEFLPQCSMPVVLFHGDADEVIYYESSVKLKALMKPTDTLITLKGQAHGGITDNPDYRAALAEILR